MQLKIISNIENSGSIEYLLSRDNKDLYFTNDNWFIGADSPEQIKSLLMHIRIQANDNSIYFEFWPDCLIIKSKQIIKPKRIVGRRLV